MWDYNPILIWFDLEKVLCADSNVCFARTHYFIMIYGNCLVDHNKKLVFQWLRKYNLKPQLSKCQCLGKKVTYLVHIFSEKGIKPDPNKVSSVRNFQVSTNRKQLKLFLGLPPIIAILLITFSLYRIHYIKKNVSSQWTDQYVYLFSILKEKLVQPPIF